MFDVGERPWNWCWKCRQPVDCTDVHDGSEVRCWGCERWFTVVEYEGETWGLTPHKPARKAGTKEVRRG